jgi:hypothetical protein
MPHNRLEDLLGNSRITEVYFGSEGFRIYTPAELEKGQHGYSIHPDGTDLTGQGEGKWEREWVVIGYDADLGDPYFVDTGSDQMPVYTAMHGVGEWIPNLVSPAVQNFLSCLEHLQAKSGQDYSLIEPDDSTLTERDRIKDLKEEMNRLNGEEEFWEAFFERHVEWLEENDR